MGLSSSKVVPLVTCVRMLDICARFFRAAVLTVLVTMSNVSGALRVRSVTNRFKTKKVFHMIAGLM